MLTIFRGDDLAFAEFDRKVCVRFNTCLDLTGWSAKFCLFDDIKATNDISSRIWTFGYTAEETQVFPLGKTFGKLIISDSSGRIRQMAKVEVEIVNQKLEPCIAGTIAISVDNVVADYFNMGNKPSLNGKVIVGDHDAAYYGLATAEDVAQFQGLSNTVQMMSATVTDQGEAIANNYLKLVALKEQVDNLPVGKDYDTQIAALNQQIAALSAQITTQAEQIASNSTRIEGEIESREAADDALSGQMSAESTARENADAALRDQINAEKNTREANISAIQNGTMLINSLLFKAEGDDNNFYRIQVVMRDDGTGQLLPALALDAEPVEDSSSDSEES